MSAGPPRHVVVLTGAGVSAESGLGTFRDKDGLWTRYDLEEVATPEGFRRNPALVCEFYNARRENLRKARPNEAHRALAAFERRFQGRFTLITQNVDDLHEKGGSPAPVHMHGRLDELRCQHCAAVYAYDAPIAPDSVCPFCGREGGQRPNVVWFGEMPLHMDAIDAALADCDLFVAIGTSATVYPAAGFVGRVRAMGRARCAELNLEPTAASSLFDETRYGPASEVVPAFFAALA